MVVKNPSRRVIDAHAEAMLKQTDADPVGARTVDTGDLYALEAQPAGLMFRPLWQFLSEKDLRTRTKKENLPVLWRGLRNPAAPPRAEMRDYPKLEQMLMDCVGKEYEKKPMQFVLGSLSLSRARALPHPSPFASSGGGSRGEGRTPGHQARHYY